MNPAQPRVEFEIHFKADRRGRKRAVVGPEPTRPNPTGTIPRVTRLMALAIRFDELIRTGEVRDQAEIARLGHVTRARVTQVMNLLHLAPDIQESLLDLRANRRERGQVTERHLRPLAAVMDWRKQRILWRSFLDSDREHAPTSGGRLSPSSLA